MFKKLSKEKRDRLVLVMVSTLIAMVSIWQGLIVLQNRELDNLQAKKVDEEIRVNNAERLVESIEQIKVELGARSNELKLIEVDMASGDMYSWIITKINTFKTPYEVDIPFFSREVSTEVGMLPNYPYKAALFNLRGKAFFHDFGRFIADFENAFPYIQVQNIQLEPAGTATSAGGAVLPGEEGNVHPEKLAFRMEVVALVNPNAP